MYVGRYGLGIRPGYTEGKVRDRYTGLSPLTQAVAASLPANREVLDPVYVDDGRRPESSPHPPPSPKAAVVCIIHTPSKKRNNK